MFSRGRLIPGLFLSLVALSLPPLAGAQTLLQRPAHPTPAVQQPDQKVAPEPPPQLAAGTYMNVAATRAFPMNTGALVEARLLHPLYVNNALTLPTGTLLDGHVQKLVPDRSGRIWARLNGDFTPLRLAVVRFDSITALQGPVAISTTLATNALPMIQLQASAAKRRSLVGRAWAAAKQRAHDTVQFFTAPGFGGRAKTMLYSQLPYHPQSIPPNTAWSFQLNQPLLLATLGAVNPSPLPTTRKPATKPKKQKQKNSAQNPTDATSSNTPPETRWMIHAVLTTPLNSKTAKVGDPVEALVVEPVLDQNHAIAIPQGAMLVGKVANSKPARSFGRSGKLRFNFQQVRFPEKPPEAVRGALAGALAPDGMSLDAEGNLTDKHKGSVLVPLALGLLAGHALDTDGNMTAQTGVASNGFGLAGRVAGLTAGSRSLAAGIGFYAVGLTITQTWLRPGHQIVFPEGSRIQIDTAPLTSPVLKPLTPP